MAYLDIGPDRPIVQVVIDGVLDHQRTLSCVVLALTDALGDSMDELGGMGTKPAPFADPCSAKKYCWTIQIWSILFR